MEIFKKNYLNLISIFGFLSTCFFVGCCYKIGIFTSQVAMNNFISSFGVIGPIIFIIIQAIQVIIPIIPASITCGFACLFWGGVVGFILNYIGICIGSIIAFYLARIYGKSFVKKVIGDEKYNKCANKYLNNNYFEKIFAVLIFLPLAPDDILCYFAGLTNMKVKKFILIILLGKVFGIIFYSLFLVKIFKIIGLG